MSEPKYNVVPKFKNRPNDHIRYGFSSPSTGVKINQDYFISRAAAVVGVIFALRSGGLQVLITQRSPKMMDEPNKFCVPCGYLDWNETGYEAMMREVYEETSFYIKDFSKYLKFNNDEQPFKVRTDPKINRQNVALLYVSYFDFSGFDLLKFSYFVEDYKNKETTMVKWMYVKDIFEDSSDIEWAFNHDITIKKALDFLHEKVKI